MIEQCHFVYDKLWAFCAIFFSFRFIISLNTFIVSRLEFFCLVPNGARWTESHITKNHCLPQISLRKTVIQFLGMNTRNQLILWFFVFQEFIVLFFAFRSILYRRHLQISIFPSILNSFILGLQSSVNSCIELLHCVRDCWDFQISH